MHSLTVSFFTIRETLVQVGFSFFAAAIAAGFSGNEFSRAGDAGRPGDLFDRISQALGSVVLARAALRERRRAVIEPRAAENRNARAPDGNGREVAINSNAQSDSPHTVKRLKWPLETGYSSQVLQSWP